MSKILSDINTFAEKYNGIFSVAQFLTPIVFAGLLWVITLYMNNNFVPRKEFDIDKDKTELKLDQIKNKLDVIILSQAANSTKLIGIAETLQDHSSRLIWLERKDTVRQ